VAMINLQREMDRRGLEARMILQVHDELLFEVPRAEVEELKRLVLEIMPNAVPSAKRLSARLDPSAYLISRLRAPCLP